MRPNLQRSIGTAGGLAIMMGIMIGGGIFAAPTVVAAHLGSPALVLAMWAAGGLLALFGGLTYAELAAMHPESGGIYVYLREAYGRAAAFVFGWSHLLITKPLGAAGVAYIFADHLSALAGWPAATEQRPSHQNPAVWTTIVVLTVLTAINARGVKLGAAVAVALTSFKFLVLAAIVAVALALWKGDAANLHAAPAPEPFGLAIVPVMAAILWTYDGWSDVGAVAGEVREPGRMLPRIFFLGTALIIGAYLAVNAVYMWMVPLAEMRGRETVAPLVMERLVGPGGAALVTAIVLVSTLGSTHGAILTGARVSYAQARDGLLFAVLGRVHPRYGTPAVSLWAQLAMSVVAVWHQRSFANLASGFVFTMWIFYGLAAAALIVLRVKRPGAARPYRCWGYPVVPGLFVLAAAAMTTLSIWEDVADPNSRGMRTLPWLAVLAAGWPVYWVWMKMRGRGSESRA